MTAFSMETTNISLDKRIVDDARLYAKRQGISLSELIERYLSRIISKDKSATAGIPDKVLSLLGAGEPVDEDDINGRKAYHGHLKRKYE